MNLTPIVKRLLHDSTLPYAKLHITIMGFLATIYGVESAGFSDTVLWDLGFLSVTEHMAAQTVAAGITAFLVCVGRNHPYLRDKMAEVFGAGWDGDTFKDGFKNKYTWVVQPSVLDDYISIFECLKGDVVVARVWVTKPTENIPTWYQVKFTGDYPKFNETNNFAKEEAAKRFVEDTLTGVRSAA